MVFICMFGCVRFRLHSCIQLRMNYTCTRTHTHTHTKTIPLQAWTGPQGFGTSRVPESLGNRHMKVVSLSVLGTGRLYPRRYSLYLFMIEAEQTARPTVSVYVYIFYTITVFNLLVPTCAVRQVILLRETGVVHRIKYRFNYFFFYLLLYLLNFIFDIK